MMNRFFFFKGGYFAGNFSLEWRAGEFLYKASLYPLIESSADLVAYRTSEVDLSRFVEKLRGFRVWEKKYESPILDGVQWKLEADFCGGSIRSSGSNVFPPDFDELIKALQELTGNMDCFERVPKSG